LIGKIIRTKRTEKNMSLKELAEKTGLTASFLSQVERGFAEPSITSLRQIAEALDVPIFYFLIEEQKPNPVVRKNERKILKLPKSHLRYELLSPDLNRKMEIMIGCLDVAASSVDGFSTHPGEECICILRGSMKVVIGEEEYMLEEGDSIYYFAEIPHRLENCGEVELVFFSAITPARF